MCTFRRHIVCNMNGIHISVYISKLARYYRIWHVCHISMDLKKRNPNGF